MTLNKKGHVVSTTKNKLTYPVNGIIDANTPSFKLKKWDDFIAKYSPKLSAATTDVPGWMGVFERSCEIHRIPLEKRYDGLISVVMDQPLRQKLFNKQNFWKGLAANNIAGRYLRVRKWLVDELELIENVHTAARKIQTWRPQFNRLSKDFEEWTELIERYIYQVRFAISHGIEPARIEPISESKLFNWFVVATGKDMIRKEASKHTAIKNIAILKLVIEQLGKEVEIPAEYKHIKAELNIIEAEKPDETNEEIEFMGRYQSNRNGYNKYNQYGINNNFSRGRDRRRNDRYKRNGFRNRINGNKKGNWSDSLYCSHCGRTNHVISKCFMKDKSKKIKKMEKEGMSKKAIADYCRGRRKYNTKKPSVHMMETEKLAGTGKEVEYENAAYEHALNQAQQGNDVKFTPEIYDDNNNLFCVEAEIGSVPDNGNSDESTEESESEIEENNPNDSNFEKLGQYPPKY